MPLPVILPALIALGLTVAETAEDSPGEWTISIEKMDFVDATVPRTGSVVIDFDARKIVSWVRGASPPPINGDHAFVVGRVNGDNVRQYFEQPRVVSILERVRDEKKRYERSVDGSKQAFAEQIVVLNRDIERMQGLFGEILSAKDLVRRIEARLYWFEALELILTGGNAALDTFVMDDDIVITTDKERSKQISKFIREMFDDSRRGCEGFEVTRIPSDDSESELKNLLDLPSNGFILRFYVQDDGPYGDLSDELVAKDLFWDLPQKHPDNFEWLGVQEDGSYIWRLWKR